MYEYKNGKKSEKFEKNPKYGKNHGENMLYRKL